MAQVPLNHFARASAALKTTYTQVYSAPTDTAAIMLTMLATNTTGTTQTVTVTVSGNGDGVGNIPTRPAYDLVTTFQIAGNDVVNLAVGKIVLENYDGLYIKAGNNSALNMTCSVLETLNTQ